VYRDVPWPLTALPLSHMGGLHCFHCYSSAVEDLLLQEVLSEDVRLLLPWNTASKAQAEKGQRRTSAAGAGQTSSCCGKDLRASISCKLACTGWMRQTADGRLPRGGGLGHLLVPSCTICISDGIARQAAPGITATGCVASDRPTNYKRLRTLRCRTGTLPRYARARGSGYARTTPPPRPAGAHLLRVAAGCLRYNVCWSSINCTLRIRGCTPRLPFCSLQLPSPDGCCLEFLFPFACIPPYSYHLRFLTDSSISPLSWDVVACCCTAAAARRGRHGGLTASSLRRLPHARGRGGTPPWKSHAPSRACLTCTGCAPSATIPHHCLPHHPRHHYHLSSPGMFFLPH